MPDPAKSVKVLGIDQAFQFTGWAVGTPDGPVACGLLDTSGRRFDSLGVRFMKFERGIAELLDTHKPSLVVFEEHRAHHGVQAAQTLGAVTALVMKLSDERSIPYTAVPVKTLKKHATGSATASKILMVAAARKKFPSMAPRIVSDVVADALHMMQWGLTQF